MRQKKRRERGVQRGAREGENGEKMRGGERGGGAYRGSCGAECADILRGSFCVGFGD